MLIQPRTSSIPAYNPPLRLIAAFDRLFPAQTPTWVIHTPGHDAWIAAAPAASDETFTYTLGCTGHDDAAGVVGRAVLTWQSAYYKRTVYQRPLPYWARYPAGVIVDLCAAGMDTPNLRAVLLGEETSRPRYEYGLGLAVAALWHEIHGQPYSQDMLREVVDRVRREYIGG